MNEFNKAELKKLFIPHPSSHKGQNGKLLIIGGSHLFHAASLWALKVASRIVDMVYYASVAENNEIVQKFKEEFRDGIVVPRGKMDGYMQEADAVLIGPGMPRPDGQEASDDDTRELTVSLFKRYPNKQWIVDGGSLQVVRPEELPKGAILTPHHKEFTMLFGVQAKPEHVEQMAKHYGVIIVSKEEEDIVCSASHCLRISGGNAGMTKGGTGDALAGLIAALATKNDPFLAASAGSYLNKKAGESLSKKVGLYFNTSDLVDEIPRVMRLELQQ